VPEIRIHPDTAQALGITDGSQVRIETRNGAIVQTASVTPEVSPEVVCAVHGWWFFESGAHRRQSWQASNLNMLTSATTLGRQFGTPAMRAIACRIGPA
jgi:anaerobic selenocysteine-containing dehydrogenase